MTPTVAARRQRMSWPRTRMMMTTTRPTMMPVMKTRSTVEAASFLERRRW